MVEKKISNSLKYSSKNAHRMCICCRERYLQGLLLRLCVMDDKMSVFCGFGRSFYLCLECMRHPKVLDKVARIKKLRDEQKNQLKEIIALWQ